MNDDLVAHAINATHQNSACMTALAREGFDLRDRGLIGFVLFRYLLGKPVTVKDIGYELRVSKPTAIRLVTNMVSAGWLDKRRVTEDRRRVQITPGKRLSALMQTHGLW